MLQSSMTIALLRTFWQNVFDINWCLTSRGVVSCGQTEAQTTRPLGQLDHEGATDFTRIIGVHGRCHLGA